MAFEAVPTAAGPASICSTLELLLQNSTTGTTGKEKQDHLRVTWMVHVTKGQPGIEAAASNKLLEGDQLRGEADGKSRAEMLCRRHHDSAALASSSAVLH